LSYLYIPTWDLCPLVVDDPFGLVQGQSISFDGGGAVGGPDAGKVAQLGFCGRGQWRVVYQGAGGPDLHQAPADGGGRAPVVFGPMQNRAEGLAGFWLGACHLSNVVKTTVIPDEEGKPCPPRWKRLLPHSSTSHHPSRLRAFACPIISASREGAKT